MPDDPQNQQSGAQPASSGLTIPADVQQKFGPLIELIKGSESMNDEERQYWINILPIMTEEQIKNLQEILANEKQQLAAIDEKYSQEIAKVGEEQTLKRIGDDRRTKREKRQTTEQDAAQAEQQSEEDLLKKIDNS